MDGIAQLHAIREHAADLLTAWSEYLSATGKSRDDLRWDAVYVWLVSPCENGGAELAELLSDWDGEYLSHPHARHILSTEDVLRSGSAAEQRLADVIARVLRAAGIEPRPHYVRERVTWSRVERPQTIGGYRP